MQAEQITGEKSGKLEWKQTHLSQITVLGQGEDKNSLSHLQNMVIKGK